MLTQSFIAILLVCAANIAAADCPDYVSQLDMAWIRFSYTKTQAENVGAGPIMISVDTILDECYKCLGQNLVNVTANAPLTQDSYFLFSSSFSGVFYFYDEITTEDPTTLINATTRKLLLSTPFDFKEHGNYTIKLADTYDKTKAWTGITYNLVTDVEGVNSYIPIYIAIGIFIGLAILYNLVYYLIYKQSSASRNFRDDEGIGLPKRISDVRDGLLINADDGLDRNSQQRVEVPIAKGKNMKERLQSLDTFRGIALSIMIFVNAGAGGYPALDHAPWNGLHFADLVFPWFIWMMGVSMAISFASQQRRGMSKSSMLVKVLIRSAKLAFLTIMDNEGSPFDQLRIPGVLMRFAISYLFVSLIIIYVPKKKRAAQGAGTGYDFILDNVYELIPIGLIVILWLGLTFGLRVPGCPTGYLGPGGLLGDYGHYPDCTGGAAGYIDRRVLGTNHIYGQPTAQPIYLTQAYDPEGILGCLTSITMVYFGLMAGRVILYHTSHKERITRWLIGAVALGCVSLFLCHGSKNEGWIPINKNMWSLSFIVTLACFGLIALSLLYILIDVMKLWGGSPFKAMGMNSILLYAGSSFLYSFFPFSIVLNPVNGCYNPNNDTHAWLLFDNLKDSIVWMIIANWMHYEKFYVNI